MRDGIERMLKNWQKVRRERREIERKKSYRNEENLTINSFVDRQFETERAHKR